jgi:hypothetical protein
MGKLEARNAGGFKNQKLTHFIIWMRHGVSIAHSPLQPIHASKNRLGSAFKSVYEKL